MAPNGPAGVSSLQWGHDWYQRVLESSVSLSDSWGLDQTGSNRTMIPATAADPQKVHLKRFVYNKTCSVRQALLWFDFLCHWWRWARRAAGFPHPLGWCRYFCSSELHLIVSRQLPHFMHTSVGEDEWLCPRFPLKFPLNCARSDSGFKIETSAPSRFYCCFLSPSSVLLSSLSPPVSICAFSRRVWLLKELTISYSKLNFFQVKVILLQQEIKLSCHKWLKQYLTCCR